MKKHTLKIFVIFSAISLLIMLISMPVSAEITLEECINNYTIPKQRYDTMLSGAYLKNNSTESDVNLQSGEFNYTQTDYSLPGKNGLDLNITRLYKSGQSTLYEMKTKLYLGSITDDHLVKNWNDYDDKDDYWTFYEKRYNLGPGTRFSFPTIEVKEASDGTQYKYLHTESGGVFRLIGPTNVGGSYPHELYTYKLEGYELDDIQVIEENEGSSRYDYTESGNKNGKSKYVMIDKDGKKTYFSGWEDAEQEGRILGIVDRFGNEIRFDYGKYYYNPNSNLNNLTRTRLLISNITDTVGREVRFNYEQKEDFHLSSDASGNVDENLDHNFDVKITTPDNQMIVYEKSSLQNQVFQGDKISTRERIQRVRKLDDESTYNSNKNAEDNIKYQFVYEQQDCDYTFVNGDDYSHGNTWDNLKYIINCKTNQMKTLKYDYATKELGISGSIRYRKVIENTDLLYDDWAYSTTDQNELIIQGKEEKKKLLYTYNDQPYAEVAGKALNSVLDFESDNDMKIFGRGWKRYAEVGKDGSIGITNSSTVDYTYSNGLYVYTDKPIYLVFDLKHDTPNIDGLSIFNGTRKIKHYTEITDGWVEEVLQIPLINLSGGQLGAIIQFVYQNEKNSNGERNKRVYLDNIKVVKEYSTEVKDALDPKGTTTKYIYGPKNRIMEVQQSGTDHYAVQKNKYDSRDMLSERSTLKYNKENGVLVDVANEQKESFVYDSYGNLKQYTGPSGEKTVYHYKLVSTYETVSKLYKLDQKVVYNSSGTELQRTEFDIEDDGNIDKEYKYYNYIPYIENHTKSTTDYDYDEAGNITKISTWTEEKPAEVFTTNYVYDSVVPNSDKDMLYPTKVYTGNEEAPLSIKEYTYDFNTGLVMSEIGCNNSTNDGTVTSYDYDKDYRLLKVTYPDLSTKEYDYHSDGYNFDVMVDGHQKTYEDNNYNIRVSGQNQDLIFAYNMFGFLTKVTDAQTLLTLSSYGYDSLGNMIMSRDNNGNLVNYSYDSANRLVSKQYFDTSGAPKEELKIAYHTILPEQKPSQYPVEFMQSMTVTDEDGYQKSFYFDFRDRVVGLEVSPDLPTTEQPRHYMTKYAYDVLGNQLSVTDAKNNTTSFAYDDLNRLIKKTDALGNITEFKYNAIDKLYEKIEPNSKTTQYQYDAAGRLTLEKIGSTASIPSIYRYTKYDAYDRTNNVLSISKGHTDSGVTAEVLDSQTTYIYNNRNRVGNKYDLIEGTDYAKTSYRYDTAGNKTVEQTFADNDDSGIDEATKGYIQTVATYDRFNRITSESTTGEYHDNGVDEFSCGTIKRGYKYDDNGNIIEYHEYFGPGDMEYYTTNYAYDYRNRLTEKREPIEETGNQQRKSTFSYDNRGNLIRKTLEKLDDSSNIVPLNETYQYDGMGNLISKTDALIQTTRFAYDQNGNKIIQVDGRHTGDDIYAEPGIHYSYDALNRLSTKAKFEGGTETITDKMEYDGRGNVIKLMTGEGLANGAVGDRLEYDATDNLVKFTSAAVVKQNPANIGKEMRYDGVGRLLSETQYVNSSQSYTTAYEYYKNGLLHLKQYPDSSKLEKYEYDETGKLFVNKTDRNGGITSVFKNIFGLPYRTEYPIGTETTTYNLYLGLALLIKDRNERQKSRKYDKAKNLLEESVLYNSDDTYDYCKVTKYTYDEWGSRKTAETFDSKINRSNSNETRTSLNDKVTVEYDKLFREHRIIGPNSRETIKEYDEAGNIITTKVKVSEGNDDVNRYEYDILNCLVSATVLVKAQHLTSEAQSSLPNDPGNPDKKQLTTTYTYSNTSRNEISKQTDSRGYVTEYIRNLDGKITQAKMPHGNTITYAYDDFRGNLTSQTNTKGGYTKYEYDAFNRVKTMKMNSPAPENPTDVTWSWDYDEMGNTTQQTMPSGGYTTYTYDLMNRRTSASNAEGELIEAVEYDALGNVLKKVDGLRCERLEDLDTAEGESYTYNKLNQIVTKADALGHVTNYEYDLAGNLTKETKVAESESNNIVTQYTYDTDNTLLKVEYPDGGEVSYTYDKKGRMLTRTAKQSATTSMEYSYIYTAMDKIYAEEDPYHNIITYQYDASGNTAAIKDKREYISTFVYNGNNAVVSKSVPLDQSIINQEYYEYDTAGNLIRKTTLGGAEGNRITEYSYLPNGQVSRIATNAGGEVTYAYDGSGNVSEIKTLRDTVSGASAYDVVKQTYDKYGRLTSTTKLISADSIYNLAGIETIDGKAVSKTQYSYNVLGMKEEEILPMGSVTGASEDEYKTTYVYDKLNRLKEIKREYHDQPVATVYEYDEFGNTVSVQDEKGNATSYTYDTMGRVLTVKNAKNVTIEYQYDLAGNRIQEVRPKGTWEYQYDLLNRLTITKNPDGDVVSKNIYDENGNVKKVIDGEGYHSALTDDARYGVVYTYNAANMVTAVTYPEGGTTHYQYNRIGNKTAVADPLGHITQYQYDQAGRLVAVIDAKNVTTAYSYDQAGNQTSMTDGNGHITKYAYGDFGMVIAITDAKDRSQYYKYDINGSVAQEIDRNGGEIRYEYNNRGLLIQKNAVTTGQIITYNYDEMGNRTYMCDAVGADAYTYEYDELYRLETVKKGGDAQISYGYGSVNNDDEVDSITYKDTTINYAYDNQNRLTNVSGGGVSAAYGYDDGGNVTEIEYGSGGIKEQRQYNKNNAVKTVKHITSEGTKTTSYTYDLAGRQISKNNQYGLTGYTYDEVGRISSVTMQGKVSVYTYDNAGNRTGLTETHTSTMNYKDNQTGQYVAYNKKVSSYTYSDTNQLASLDATLYNGVVEKLKINTTYSYDKNGNMVSGLSSSYRDTAGSAALGVSLAQDLVTDLVMNEYDGFNQLTKTAITREGKTVSTAYAYNGDGLRTSKTVEKSEDGSSKTTDYLYSGQYVVSEMGDTTATYVRGLNYIAKIGVSNNVNYYQYNVHGDVVQMVDSTGVIKNRYDYDVFGEATLSVEEAENSIRYAGEFYDQSAGLYYLRARYYDPAIGRFITEDTYRGNAADTGTLNLYAYCHNDPVNYSDPSGHFEKEDFDNVSDEGLNEIAYWTKRYYEATDDAGRDYAHNEAQKIRSNSAYARRAGAPNIYRDYGAKFKQEVENSEYGWISIERWYGGVNEANVYWTGASVQGEADYGFGKAGVVNITELYSKVYGGSHEFDGSYSSAPITSAENIFSQPLGTQQNIITSLCYIWGIDINKATVQINGETWNIVTLLTNHVDVINYGENNALVTVLQSLLSQMGAGNKNAAYGLGDTTDYLGDKTASALKAICDLVVSGDYGNGDYDSIAQDRILGLLIEGATGNPDDIKSIRREIKNRYEKYFKETGTYAEIIEASNSGGGGSGGSGSSGSSGSGSSGVSISPNWNGNGFGDFRIAQTMPNNATNLRWPGLRGMTPQEIRAYWMTHPISPGSVLQKRITGEPLTKEEQAWDFMDVYTGGKLSAADEDQDGSYYDPSSGMIVKGSGPKSKGNSGEEMEGGSGGNVKSCFTAGTQIPTEDGYKPIEEVKVGDYVWSENPQTGEKGLKKVVRTFIHDKDKLLYVHIDDTVIKTTEEHPFWVEGKGWVLAGELKEGDILRLKSDENVKITKLELEKLQNPVKVYNFEVEDWHTYFVSDINVLVHNKAKANNIPENAYDTLDKIEQNGGKAPGGYTGGAPYRNDGRGKTTKIPNSNENVTYTEYDVNPTYWNQDRGGERIVIGSDGTVWYTPDHYKTWIQMK